jgi:hypothetical protein
MVCGLSFGQTITLLRMCTCFRRKREAKIELGDPNGHPRLIDNRRMKRADLVKALRAVFEHRSMLMQKWSEIHE